MSGIIIDPNSPASPAPETTSTGVSVPSDTLGVIIPSATGRKIAYAIYAGVALVVSNIGVAFTAASLQAPTWLVIALAVVGNLGTVFGGVALANVKGK